MKHDKTISSFLGFLQNLATTLFLKIDFDKLFQKNNEYEIVSDILHKLSQYFYQSNSALEARYFSEFHKYWESNHKDIINPVIDKNACLELARALEELYKYNVIKTQLDPLDLSKEEIARVRFFTTIQDFKIDINAKVNPFELQKRFPELFKPEDIVKNPHNINKLLNYLGATDQGDKRQKWMLKAAQLLIDEYEGEAINIANKNSDDVNEIVGALTEGQDKYGYSIKKTHIFIRDLLDLRVWYGLKNIEMLDTVSDQNTMRIALRTGILKTKTPLISSFLDVYCYQYSLIDEYNRKAWREVWIQWAKIKDNHRPVTPASYDYLIYRMGKVACKKTSRICPPNKKVSEQKYKKLDSQDRLIFKDEYCIFAKICKLENKILNPPRSISQKQRTGWDNAKTNEGGGGGLSS